MDYSASVNNGRASQPVKQIVNLTSKPIVKTNVDMGQGEMTTVNT